MADDNEEDSKVKDPPSISPSYLEVICKSSGKTRRFSSGTEAGFALNLINRKLGYNGDGCGLPMALYIEAVKEGEEPVSFGPNSMLVNYGHGWKLQTVTLAEGGLKTGVSFRRTAKRQSSEAMDLDSSHSTRGLLPPVITVQYILKILLAFVFLFVFGAIFTLALENLPRLISFVNTSM